MVRGGVQPQQHAAGGQEQDDGDELHPGLTTDTLGSTADDELDDFDDEERDDDDNPGNTCNGGKAKDGVEGAPEALQLTGSPFPRVNGKYVRVEQLPPDAREQPAAGYPIYKNEACPEIYILRAADANANHGSQAWFIAHYQPGTEDYYFAKTQNLPEGWEACEGKGRGGELRMQVATTHELACARQTTDRHALPAVYCKVGPGVGINAKRKRAEEEPVAEASGEPRTHYRAYDLNFTSDSESEDERLLELNRQK